MRELTGGSGADVSIEAVGYGVTARQTIGAVRNSGTVLWLGNSEREIEIDMQAVVTRDLVVRGSYGMTGQEFERALTLLADGRLPVADIVNRYASLDEGPRAVRGATREPGDHQVRHPAVAGRRLTGATTVKLRERHGPVRALP